MTDKRPERDDTPKIDLNINLGGVFKGLGEMMNLIADLAQQAGELSQQGGELRQSGEFKPKGQEGLRGVYGFSIRSGIGGVPQVERFGNLRRSEQGPEVAEVREPLVDLFDEGAQLAVIAELPGVSDEEIQVLINGDVVAIETSGERRYAKELLLTSAVDRASLQRSYRNGILELRLRKI